MTTLDYEGNSDLQEDLHASSDLGKASGAIAGKVFTQKQND